MLILATTNGNEWTAISNCAVAITCFAIVNNTYLIHSVPKLIDTPQLLRDAQQVLALREEMLQATGGALAPDKS